MQPADVMRLGRRLGAELAQLAVEGFELGEVVGAEGKAQQGHAEHHHTTKTG
jgi:hypothetical protein